MMPHWVARELGVHHLLPPERVAARRPPKQSPKRVPKQSPKQVRVRERVPARLGATQRAAIEQVLARTGSIAAAMRETSAGYDVVQTVLREMAA